MSMDSQGIKNRLDEIREAKDDLPDGRRAETGKVYLSVDNRLYEIDRVVQMIQRDEVTVVCPVIVAGTPL